MKKVICESCNTKNLVKKDSTSFYCSSCGKKCNINPEPKKSIKKAMIIIISIIFLMAIIGCLVVRFVLLPAKQKNKFIKVSELAENCSSSKSCYMNSVIKNHISSIGSYKIKDDIRFESIDKEYKVKIIQFGKEKEMIFTLKDDIGPTITPKKITLALGEEYNLSELITITDFVDGDIALDSENVKVDASSVDVNKEGTYYIHFDLTDSLGNKTSKKVKVVVKKIKPESIELNLNDSYVIKNDITLNAILLPDNTYDKSISWYYLNSNNEKTKIDGNKVVFQDPGEYNICGYATNHKSVSDCKNVIVKNNCPSKYVFNFEGGSTEYLHVGEMKDICPGKYRITVKAFNKSPMTGLTINYGSYGNRSFDSISQYYGGNGDKYVLNDDISLIADPGIIKVTLVKIK